MIRKSMPSGCDPMGGYRFSEENHAQTISQNAMTTHPELIALWQRPVVPEVPSRNASILRQLRRGRRHKMLFQNQRYDQQRRRQKAAHWPPQPGPEGEPEEHRERVQ